MHLGIDSEQAISFWLWAGQLWPIVLSATCLYLLRSRIAKPIAFLVLGSLVCFGVQWLVSQVSLLLLPTSPDDATVSEQLLLTVLFAFAQSMVLTAAFSLLPLWWLYRVLRVRPDPVIQKISMRKTIGGKKRRRREDIGLR